MSCIRLAALSFVFVVIAGCMSAKSIEGYVVDTETGEPVPDVIVMVAWRVLAGLHGQTRGFLVLDETVTDSNGYYYLPGWSGKWPGFFSSVEDSSPELNFFKYGYIMEHRSNYRIHFGDAPVQSPRESIWDKKKVELKPFHGDEKGKLKALSVLSHYYTARPGCTSSRLPILSKEIRRLNAFAKTLPNVGSTRLPTLDPRNKVECIYRE